MRAVTLPPLALAQADGGPPFGAADGKVDDYLSEPRFGWVQFVVVEFALLKSGFGLSDFVCVKRRYRFPDIFTLVAELRIGFAIFLLPDQDELFTKRVRGCTHV